MSRDLRESFRSILEQKNTKIFFWCFGIVILWRLLLEITNHTLIKLVMHTRESMPGINWGLDRWLAWDGKWYYSLFERGYTFDPSLHIQSNVAFFPGFPVLTQIMSSLTHLNPVYSGLLVNLVLTIFSCYFIYQITSILAAKFKLTKASGVLASKVSVGLFLLFPSSLFLAAFYAEALLIFGISGSIYYALKNKLYTALIFAGIASSAKILGVATLPTVLVLYFMQNPPKNIGINMNLIKQILTYGLYCLVGLAGLLGYMLFLFINFGDPILFTHIQQAWDRDLSSIFFVNIWSGFYKHLLSPTYFGGTYNYLVSLQAMLLPIFAGSAALYIALTKKMYWLLVLTGILIFLPMSTSTLTSMNRYVYSAVPLFSLIAIFFVYKKQYVALSALAAVMAVILIYQTTGFLTALHFAG